MESGHSENHSTLWIRLEPSHPGCVEGGGQKGHQGEREGFRTSQVSRPDSPMQMRFWLLRALRKQLCQILGPALLQSTRLPHPVPWEDSGWILPKNLGSEGALESFQWGQPLGNGVKSKACFLRGLCPVSRGLYSSPSSPEGAARWPLDL